MYYDQNSFKFFGGSKLYNFVDFVFYVWRYVMDETERLLNNPFMWAFIEHQKELCGYERKCQYSPAPFTKGYSKKKKSKAKMTKASRKINRK